MAATTNEYEREWRTRMEKRQDIADAAQENTAIIQERIMGRLEGHDRRLNAIEASPAGLRDWLGVMIAAGGCLITPFVSASLAVLGSLLVWIITRAH